MKIIWSALARQDVAEIVLFIAQDNPLAALELDDCILAAAERLAVFPKLGKPGLMAGTRELVAHNHYVLVYEVEADAVFILTVLHTSRQWPPE